MRGITMKRKPRSLTPGKSTSLSLVGSRSLTRRGSGSSTRIPPPSVAAEQARGAVIEFLSSP